jgi:hypothetical protein
MSSTWNGSALQIRYAQKYGFSDSTSYIRVLEWMNDIQNDIQASHAWPFLKFKMKKQVTSSDHEIDISPQIPSAPVIALAAGGTITADSVCYVKTTFVIFDESGKEINSLESEPSSASNAITVSAGNLSLSVTGISTYSGVSTVKPITIHRRIYLKIGTAAYFLSATLTDNTTTIATLSTVPTSVVEPPEYSLVSCMSGEDPLIEGSGITIYENKLDTILKFDPNFTSTGTPQYYARVTPTKILLYPRPSSTYTISYWVYRIPSRIFADADRPIQLYHALKEVLDAGVTWKFYEYKDSDGQESKKLNYEQRKQDAKGVIGRSGGQRLSVKVVC